MDKSSKHPTKNTEALYDEKFWQNFLPTDSMKRAFAAVLSLLTAGEPVTIEQVSEKAKVPVADVQAFFEQAPVEWDGQHRIIGFGITSTPTDHGYEVNGHKLYVWCAGDALVFPVITGIPAHITSVCHVTGQPITIDVSPEKVTNVKPETAVVSSVPWEEIAWGEIRQVLCSNTNFFASTEIAQAWLDKHPGSAIVPVASQFETQRRGILATLGGSLAEEKDQ